jgi:hypothetical protein
LALCDALNGGVALAPVRRVLLVVVDVEDRVTV